MRIRQKFFYSKEEKFCINYTIWRAEKIVLQVEFDKIIKVARINFKQHNPAKKCLVFVCKTQKNCIFAH
jgi:hypothetical protein